MFSAKAPGPKLGETVIIFTSKPIQGEDSHVGIVTKVFDERTIAAFVMPAFSNPLLMVGLHKRGVVNVIGTPSWDYPEIVDRAAPGQGDGLDSGEYNAAVRIMLGDHINDDEDDEDPK